MIAEELISFRKNFWPSRFPIEARVYAFGSFGPSRTPITQRIASPEALSAFQDELTRQESAHDWRFIAYYEPIVP
jgi:hypothetical protein